MILAAYPVVIGALGLVNSGPADPALGRTVKSALTISAIEMSLFGVVFVAAWAFSRASRAELLLFQKLRFRDIPLSLLYSVGLRLGVVAVAAALAVLLAITGFVSMDQIEEFVGTNRPDVEALVDVRALRENPLYLIVNATLVSFVVAGFREELWRVGVLAGLRALWPARFGSWSGQLLVILG